MESHSASSAAQEQQARALLLFLVVVGYIVTFITASRGGTHYSAGQLPAGVAYGVIYLVLVVFEAEILQRFSTNMRNALFFSIQIALVFGIGWTLGPGGNWLIGLPLASLAVERVPPRWCWPVYLGILASIIFPIVRYSTLETAFMNTLFIAPGIFFVALVTQMRVNEKHARERAESLTRQLETANHQLAEYASQAEELAATQERNRLAREIHDNLGHYLTIVNVQIEAAKVTLGSNPKRALDSLDRVHELTKKGLVSVRESVSALRVSPLEDRPLQEAICALVGEMQTTGITANLDVLGEPRCVDEKVGLTLYRAVQEGLTNVRKHSHASRVDVELDLSRPDKIRLALRDDGVGAADTSGGFGLIGIRERIRLLRGEFKIETQVGKGFCFEATVPVMEEEGV